MGYRDDFYTKDNILGYTGTLEDNPTVYFADAGGINPRTVKVGGKDKVLVSFGHITQVHEIATNVGRERVGESYSYTIANVIYDGKERAQECVYGQEELDKLGLRGYPTPDGHLDWHVSRNRFESVTAGNIQILALAITKHQNIKKMHG